TLVHDGDIFRRRRCRWMNEPEDCSIGTVDRDLGSEALLVHFLADETKEDVISLFRSQFLQECPRFLTGDDLSGGHAISPDRLSETGELPAEICQRGHPQLDRFGAARVKRNAAHATCSVSLSSLHLDRGPFDGLRGGFAARGVSPRAESA